MLNSNKTLLYFSFLFGLFIMVPLFFLPGLYNSHFGAKLYLYLILGLLFSGSIFIGFKEIYLPWVSQKIILLGGVFLGINVLSAILSSNFAVATWGIFGRGEFSLFAMFIALISSVSFFSLLLAWRKIYPREYMAVLLLLFDLLVGTLITLFFVSGIYDKLFLYGRGGYNEGGVFRLVLSYPNPILLSYTVVLALSYWLVRFMQAKGLGQVLSRGFIYGLGFLVLLWTYTRGAWVVFSGTFVICSSYHMFIYHPVVQRVKRKMSKGKAKQYNWHFKSAFLNVMLMLVIMLVAILWHWPQISARNIDFTNEGANQVVADLSNITNTKITNVRDFYPDKEAITGLNSMDIRWMELQWGWQTFTKSWRSILLGIGPEQEYYNLPLDRPSILNYIPTDTYTKPYYIRNIYLHMALTGGIFSVGAFLIGNVWLLVRCEKYLRRCYLLKERKKIVRRKKIVVKGKHFFSGQLMMAGSTLIISFLGYGLLYTPDISMWGQYLMVVVLLLFLLFTEHLQKKNKKLLSLKILTIPWRAKYYIPILLVLVGGLLVTIQLWHFDKLFAQTIQRQYTIEQKLAFAYKLRRVWPIQDAGKRAVISLEQVLLEKLIDDQKSPSRSVIDVKKSMSKVLLEYEQGSLNNAKLIQYLHYDILKNLDSLSDHDGLDTDNLRILASGYYKLVRLDQDKQSGFYDRGLIKKAFYYAHRYTKADPSLPIPFDELALQYLYTKNMFKAEQNLKKSIALKSDYWFSYLHMGETLRQLCRPKDAIKYYKKAEPYMAFATGEIQEAQAELDKMSKEGCQYKILSVENLQKVAPQMTKKEVIDLLGDPHMTLTPNEWQYYASTTGECKKLLIKGNKVAEVQVCQAF